MAASHIVSPERSGRQAGASTNPGRARVGGAGAGEPAAVGRESGRAEADRYVASNCQMNRQQQKSAKETTYVSQNLNISMQSWANFICNLCVHLLNSREEPFILCLSRSSRDIAIGYSRHSCSRLAVATPISCGRGGEVPSVRVRPTARPPAPSRKWANERSVFTVRADRAGKEAG